MEMDAVLPAIAPRLLFRFLAMFLRLCRPRVGQVRNEKCIYCGIKIFISKLNVLPVWIWFGIYLEQRLTADCQLKY